MATEDWMLGDESPYEDAEPYNAIRDLKAEVKRLARLADSERESAYNAGVHDTLERLTSDEAIQVAIARALHAIDRPDDKRDWRELPDFARLVHIRHAEAVLDAVVDVVGAVVDFDAGRIPSDAPDPGENDG